MPLNAQELLNAIYSGPFVTKAKAEYSNSKNANMQKWSSYIKGDPKRQEILAEALEWVSSSQGISVDAYLAQHRHDTDITGLKTYFTSVIDWVDSVFIRPPDKEMRGLDWGRLYETVPLDVLQRGRHRRRRRTRSEPTRTCTSNKGIYEYLLGGKTDLQAARRPAVRRQDQGCRIRAADAEGQGHGRAPTARCARSATNTNKTRIYRLNEMDADHVTAWSNGGSTDLDNCEMLCVTHNRAKGNR